MSRGFLLGEVLLPDAEFWLDRKPPPPTSDNVWASWFDDETGEYLGEVSARTGPDPVASEQKCLCTQCRWDVEPGEGLL